MANSLSLAPGIAKRVGLFIAEFNDMEVQLFAAFAGAVGDKGPLSYTMLAHHRNISDRIQVMQDVIKIVKETDRLKELGELLSLAIDANSFRNALAHGLYRTKNGRTTATTWLNDKQKPTEEITLTVDLLEEKLAQIRTLNERLSSLYAGLDVTLPYKRRRSQSREVLPDRVLLKSLRQPKRPHQS